MILSPLGRSSDPYVYGMFADVRLRVENYFRAAADFHSGAPWEYWEKAKERERDELGAVGSVLVQEDSSHRNNVSNTATTQHIQLTGLHYSAL